MDDIQKALLRKLETQFSQGGWQSHAAALGANPVRFWLYSYSLEHGPRLVSQIGAELHRDMLAGTGMIADLVRDFDEPWNALAGAIDLFDQATKAGQQTEQVRQILALMLGFYARSTKTFELIQPLNEVPGTHFVVIDWKSKVGGKMLRPAHMHHDAPMSSDELKEFAHYVVSVHLKNRPGDAP
ncbi:hypothetical protein N7645_15155 [Pseudomonas juntendi]|uniref:hypothetical protein n=1 Tax=Pseudomonas TaxID=286 RepID=UPI0012AD6158|nr:MULTISPECIES: hypothetical protein [Pseudomonas]MDG9918226.1 hypothetical protein [Pseudomonas juntendi]MDH0507674.1 hypothetical protein [Pseudomonas juntendi]MDH1044844.1 hypothetical protein [Pseudomonas juntendi]MRT62342.1 hypothetical protein [Pseudomonas sp. CAH-1]